MKWISVNKRLPDCISDTSLSKTVLLHDKCGNIFVGFYYFDEKEWFGEWDGDEGSWPYHVTHWMPLPPPPR